jgi:alpha-tubulin suppressor-like RCC1 family protein
MIVVAIAGGTNYSVAMKANDSLFTFGRNTNGQLGDGTNTDRYLPTAVLSLCPVPTEITEYNTSESNTVFVFPNPSSNGVFHFINNNNAKKINTIEVFNMLGEKIMNTTNNNTSTGFIDLSNQANGVYLMTIKTENNVFYQKLIKQ